MEKKYYNIQEYSLFSFKTLYLFSVLIPIRLPDRHVPDSMNWSSHACSPELFRAKVSPPFGWAFSAAKTLEVHIARRLG